MSAPASGGLHLWQGLRLCLWKKDDQNGSGPLAADQAPADDGLWHGHAEVLREFHSTRQALRIKDLHHTNRITQLPTEALSSQAPSENALLEQIKNDVGSFFETTHPLDKQPLSSNTGFYGLAAFKNLLTVWHGCVAELGLSKICKIYFSIT